MDEGKKRRHGPLPKNDPRRHCVSVRLNNEELNWLDSNRGILARGEYLRCAALGKLPPVIPEINREAWQKLANAAANLNQLAKALNLGNPLTLDKIKTDLARFRLALIGADTNQN